MEETCDLTRLSRVREARMGSIEAVNEAQEVDSCV